MMIGLQVTRRAGSGLRLSVQPGVTLTEALRDNGFDELLACAAPAALAPPARSSSKRITMGWSSALLPKTDPQCWNRRRTPA